MLLEQSKEAEVEKPLQTPHLPAERLLL